MAREESSGRRNVLEEHKDSKRSAKRIPEAPVELRLGLCWWHELFTSLGRSSLELRNCAVRGPRVRFASLFVFERNLRNYCRPGRWLELGLRLAAWTWHLDGKTEENG